MGFEKIVFSIHFSFTTKLEISVEIIHILCIQLTTWSDLWQLADLIPDSLRIQIHYELRAHLIHFQFMSATWRSSKILRSEVEQQIHNNEEDPLNFFSSSTFFFFMVCHKSLIWDKYQKHFSTRIFIVIRNRIDVSGFKLYIIKLRLFFR